MITAKLIPTLLIFTLLALPLAVSAQIPDGMKETGSGQVNWLGFIKVYDASLYTTEGVTQTNLLDPTSSRCLKLIYDVDLTVENFVEAAEKVLAEQHEASVLAGVRQEIDNLHANYREVGEGDMYTLCYDATSQQTDLILNDETLVSIVSGDFAAIYFGIWLNQVNPLSERLRDQLVKGLPSS